MRSYKELMNLLRLLTLTQEELKTDLLEVRASGCDCPICTKTLSAYTAVSTQIDIVLYALGAESKTADFIAAAQAPRISSFPQGGPYRAN